MAEYSLWKRTADGAYRREIDGHVLTVRRGDGLLFDARLASPAGATKQILVRNRRAALAWAAREITAATRLPPRSAGIGGVR
jgi:hypothetical protein